MQNRSKVIVRNLKMYENVYYRLTVYFIKNKNKMIRFGFHAETFLGKHCICHI